ncbi:Insulin-like receptor [Habropoda laboriosa]|uniref:Tyrosine-protein kinase receptor n=1 Tax=Habropoda laboriosa TaxID=597456 RepID=A0A0L7R7M6_9HYME|nr:Insulin-like receptor [Habropoda laboriosa]
MTENIKRRWVKKDPKTGLGLTLLRLLLILRVLWICVRRKLSVSPIDAYISSIKVTSVDYGRVLCQSIDIRNSVTFFSRLKGCRVIEGYLQILLIDNAEPQEYANISFPELKEITGYLLFYRVKGLRSIGRLFPNLTVIRGHSLFINYALVVFEMMNLQEIGLRSLTTIVRGSVRFDKNPALCYVDTIDWDLIGKAGKGEHVIATINDRVCPITAPGERYDQLTTPGLIRGKCNASASFGALPRATSGPIAILRCALVCKQGCENNACDDAGNCCHPSCLGTCTGPTIADCVVCKDVITMDNECRDRCPNGTVEFMDHRCINESRCRQMEKPRGVYNVKNYPYKLFNGSCVIECPPGYMDEESNGTVSCKKCEGPCQKECSGAKVDSIASAQKLRGCTHITGSLEIQIRGGKNIVKELEVSLSTIEEIDGYLKIVRSFPLISLNFLKNLRVIRGNDTNNSEYSLHVLDNQNLQELWDWNMHKNIQILSQNGPGKIFFHLNPKLCLYKIELLREKVGLLPFTDYDVAPNSNGDKVACNVTELKTRVGTKSSVGAVIEWEPFIHHDARSLLGYVVYFIEAPNKNVTMYDGRDACGGDGWKVDDVPAATNMTSMKEKNVQSHYLSQLKPYTQYAYYVKTHTIATERFGAQSNLTYFRTMPDAPSLPRSLSTWSNSSSELILSWLPPLHKNGNLSNYKIVGRLERDDPNFIDQRNYCDEPILLPDTKAIALAEEERKRIEEEKELMAPETVTCECTDKETDQSLREKEASSAIAFEDAVHNQVYVKRKTRRKREASEGSYGSSRKTKASERDQPLEDKIENGSYVQFERWIPSTNHSFVMKNLSHFGAYNIEVQACRAKENNNDTFQKCSTKSMRTYRTLPMKSADNIPPNTFNMTISGKNNSLPMVKLQWGEPAHPNGLIVTYQIEYKRVDIPDYKATLVCITRQNFTKARNSYFLKELPSGNYSVRVRATSLAGNGEYTQEKYFYIEERNTVNVFWIVFSLVLCVILAIFGFVSFYVVKRKLMKGVPNRTLFATVNPDYVSTPYVLDEWEVPRENIEMLRPLGNGSFGLVYEGIAKDIVKGKPEVRCAVKTVNKDANARERNEFLNEASMMKSFDAHHVIRLLGVVSRGQPTLVIMELMVNGDLKEFLRSHRPTTSDNMSHTALKLDRILQMALQIADGMAYLSNKKFVHRDLAARNCMIAEDLTVKVGDFGMTRDIYERDYYRKGTKGLLPVRWMAPESLKDGIFSSSSDVWSYGVVLWEMVTFASQPYQGSSNDEVLREVIKGRVMEPPENCPELFSELMKRTWNHEASRRPTFVDIVSILLEHSDVENFQKVSFYHSVEGEEARRQNKTNSSPQTERQHLEEVEGEENTPLRQDFGENSQATVNSHNMNSSKAPLQASFDEFDGGVASIPDCKDQRACDEWNGLRTIRKMDVAKSAAEDFVTVVSVESQPPPENFVTVLSIGNSKKDDEPPTSVTVCKPQSNGIDGPLEEEVEVYRLPGERLGFGLKFEGGNKTSERVRRLFVQSCAEQSPASRAKCSWGTLGEGDEVLSIDGVPVTHMTRLDCVRRLKESQLVIKLMVRCRGALRPEVVSAEKKSSPEKKKVPPELPSAPPPVPPRKLRQARGLADGEANPSPVKKSWNGSRSQSSSQSSSQNGSPSSQPNSQGDSKSTSFESCESSPKSVNGSVRQDSPKGSPKERSPELAKSKQEPPEAMVYMDARSQCGSTHGSTSDDTGSSMSTVIDRFSTSDRVSTISTTSTASTASEQPNEFSRIDQDFDRSSDRDSQLSKATFENLEDYSSNPPDYLLRRLASSEAVTHVESRGEVEKITAVVAPNTVLIEETITFQPPLSFQDAPLSYGHEARPDLFYTADLAADSTTHFRPIKDDVELVERVNSIHEEFRPRNSSPEPEKVKEASCGRGTDRTPPPLPARNHVNRISVNQPVNEPRSQKLSEQSSTESSDNQDAPVLPPKPLPRRDVKVRRKRPPPPPPPPPTITPRTEVKPSSSKTADRRDAEVNSTPLKNPCDEGVDLEKRKKKSEETDDTESMENYDLVEDDGQPRTNKVLEIIEIRMAKAFLPQRTNFVAKSEDEEVESKAKCMNDIGRMNGDSERVKVNAVTISAEIDESDEENEQVTKFNEPIDESSDTGSVRNESLDRPREVCSPVKTDIFGRRESEDREDCYRSHNDINRDMRSLNLNRGRNEDETMDEDDSSEESDEGDYYWQSNLATIGEEEETNSLEYMNANKEASDSDTNTAEKEERAESPGKKDTFNANVGYTLKDFGSKKTQTNHQFWVKNDPKSQDSDFNHRALFRSTVHSRTLGQKRPKDEKTLTLVRSFV